MSETTDQLEAAALQLTETIAALEAAKAAEKAAAAPPPFVGHLTADATQSVMIGPYTVGPGDTFTITTENWAAMTAGGQQALLDFLTNPERQAKILGEAKIRKGEGPEIEWPPNSSAWYHQRRRRWAAAHDIRNVPEREAELARLQEFYSRPEQQEREDGHDVSTRYEQLPPEPSGKVKKGHKHPPVIVKFGS